MFPLLPRLTTFEKFDFIAQYGIKKLEHECISCISAIWTKHKARQIRQARKTAVSLWWCLTDFLANRKQEVHSDNFQALPVIHFFFLWEQWSEFSWPMRKYYLNMKQKLCECFPLQLLSETLDRCLDSDLTPTIFSTPDGT